MVGFCGNQVGYSLAQANPGISAWAGMLYMDQATWEYHKRSGLPVVAYSSQAQGFFSGKYGAGRPAKSQNMADLYYTPTNFARLERVRRLAEREGHSPNAVALAYLLAQPFPVHALVGCRTTGQIRDSLSAGSVELAPGTVTWLENGQGPEVEGQL
jgi:aryl-alcohol dehydrogenase-like predicted oxidoreductase